MTYPQCPRCNGEWIKSNNKLEIIMDCCKCKMHWPIYKEYMWRSFSENTELIWDFRDNCCRYVSNLKSIELIITELPMLGFDISSEKLRLYILFS